MSTTTVLKQVRIKNAFGIKESHLDFQLKNFQKDKYEFDDQIITTGKDMICMVPTFLGKNATGKTSLIKAIVFAMNLINKNSFIKTIIHYADFVFRWSHYEIENYKNTFDPHYFLTNMCEQIMFAGAKEMQIELIFTDNNVILIELTPSSFQVKINKQIIDIIALLLKLFSNNLANKTRVEINQYFHQIIKEKISNLTFLSVVNNSLFRDTHVITNINEILLKQKANKFLVKLAKNFGASELKFLLQKLDNNIVNFEYDPKSKSVSLYMEKANNLPVSANNLSFGTIKTIEILAKSIDIFKNGGVFLIDEIENGLHLSLIKLILAFYTNEEINSKNCQIILTTHNPSIFKQNIVNNFNAFMVENNDFINIKKYKAIKRTEDQKEFVNPKNYYNDLYWGLRNVDNNTTISDTAINVIICDVLNYRKNENKIN